MFPGSVVCVGGDGMFSEVMHGLIGRMQKDSGIDQNNPKAPLVQCNIRIGIIPAGKKGLTFSLLYSFFFLQFLLTHNFLNLGLSVRYEQRYSIKMPR